MHGAFIEFSLITTCIVILGSNQSPLLKVFLFGRTSGLEALVHEFQPPTDSVQPSPVQSSASSVYTPDVRTTQLADNVTPYDGPADTDNDTDQLIHWHFFHLGSPIVRLLRPSLYFHQTMPRTLYPLLIRYLPYRQPRFPLFTATNLSQ